MSLSPSQNEKQHRHSKQVAEQDRDPGREAPEPRVSAPTLRSLSQRWPLSVAFTGWKRQKSLLIWGLHRHSIFVCFAFFKIWYNLLESLFWGKRNEGNRGMNSYPRSEQKYS